MRQPRHDQRIEVADNRLERFRVLRRGRGQLSFDVAWLGLRHDRMYAGVGAVIGNPVDQPMASSAKFFRCHEALYPSRLSRSPGKSTNRGADTHVGCVDRGGATRNALHDRAKAMGAEIVSPLNDQDYGSGEFGARDLDGHLWGFGTYAMARGGEPTIFPGLHYRDERRGAVLARARVRFRANARGRGHRWGNSRRKITSSTAASGARNLHFLCA
jgi:hypothetical protein